MNKPRQLKTVDWKDISTDDAYQLSMSEFKGTTIQALQDLRDDVRELKQDAKVRNWITFGIGGFAGILASVLTALGMKH